MNPPDTKYTKVGDSYVAYQVLGDGPLDLLVMTGLVSHVDMRWEYPPLRHIFERLSSFSRLISFDRRGAGASDPVPLDALPTWEDWIEDVSAVLDATESKRTAMPGTNRPRGASRGRWWFRTTDLRLVRARRTPWSRA